MARAPRLSDLNNDEGWVKSSYSSTGGECVEVKQARTTIAVRDSKNHAAGLLTFPPSSWTSFLLSR